MINKNDCLSLAYVRMFIIVFFYLQFLFDEVNQQFIEINCPELFSSISMCRSSKHKREIPRPLTLKIHLVIDRPSAIKVYRYCTRLNVWTDVRTFDLKHKGFTTVHRNRNLIIIGGSVGQNEAIKSVNKKNHFYAIERTIRLTNIFILSQVKSIDLKSGAIIDMPSMLSARSFHSVEMLNDSIYVFGGWSEEGAIVRTAERYVY